MISTVTGKHHGSGVGLLAVGTGVVYVDEGRCGSVWSSEWRARRGVASSAEDEVAAGMGGVASSG